MPFANAKTMSLHLEEIGKQVASGAHAILVLDGAGCHAATALRVPSNISLLKLPPYAPELNPVENIWEYLRGNGLANTVFDNYDDIVDKSCEAWMRAGSACLNSFPRKISVVLPRLVCSGSPRACRDGGRARTNAAHSP